MKMDRSGVWCDGERRTTMNTQGSKTTVEGGGVDTLMGMLKEFYCREMAPWIALIWFWAAVSIVGMVWCAVRFFAAEEVKHQIAYAAGFVCFFQFIPLLKLFSWQLIHRRIISRQIRRLEELMKEVRNQK